MEDWNHVKNLQNEATKIIINAKNEYYLNLGRRLSNNLNGPRTYWSNIYATTPNAFVKYEC